MPTAEELIEVFPEGFHEALRTLILRVLMHHQSEWRADSLSSEISTMPQLQHMGWQVYRAKGDAGSEGDVQPAVLLNLQLGPAPDEQGGKGGGVGASESVNVELSKVQLDALLDGMGKIKEQLGKV